MATTLRLLLTLLVAAALAPTTSAAQQPAGTTLTMVAGVAEWDLTGVGFGPASAIRAAHPVVGRWLVGEVSLGYMRADEDFAPRPTHIGHGDVHIQLLVPSWRLTPYAGAGLSAVTFLTNAAGGPRTSLGPSGALGMRGWLTNSVAMALELRIRAWDPNENDSGFGAAAAEYLIGLTRSF